MLNKTTETLKRFRDMIRNGERQFSFPLENYMEDGVHVISYEIGEAVYCYGCHWRGDWMEYMKRPGLTYSLAAIYADDIVYFWDCSLFNIADSNSSDFPPGTMSLEFFVSDLDEYFKNIVFPEAVEKLETEKRRGVITDEIQEEARYVLLTDNNARSIDEIFKCPIKIDKYSVARGLCEGKSIEQFFADIIEENSEIIREKKRHLDLLNDAISKRNCIERWEKELSEAIYSAGTKSVMVEFNKKGKTSQIRIASSMVILNLISKKPFEIDDFRAQSDGKKLFRALNIKENAKPEKRLACRDISKVIAREKVVYERNFS